MSTRLNIRQQSDLERLTLITQGCRHDMHEPDEQQLSAHVVGLHLDNANGDNIESRALEGGWQELVVVLKRDGNTHRFNLANLIALARLAQ